MERTLGEDLLEKKVLGKNYLDSIPKPPVVYNVLSFRVDPNSPLVQMRTREYDSQGKAIKGIFSKSLMIHLDDLRL